MAEMHIGTKVRFVVQRTVRKDEWVDGLNECRVSDHMPYPHVFRTEKDGKAAVAAARKRAIRYDRPNQYRLVKHVTDFTVVD